MPADTLTPEALAELERLEKAATPGEWLVDNYDGWHLRVSLPYTDGNIEGYRRIAVFVEPERKASKADALLIAALRNAADGLLAAARERDALREAAQVAEKDAQLWQARAQAAEADLAAAREECEALRVDRTSLAQERGDFLQETIALRAQLAEQEARLKPLLDAVREYEAASVRREHLGHYGIAIEEAGRVLARRAALAPAAAEPGGES